MSLSSTSRHSRRSPRRCRARQGWRRKSEHASREDLFYYSPHNPPSSSDYFKQKALT